MTTPRLAALLLMLTLVLGACRSSGDVALTRTDGDCTCGTTEGDTLGCLHEACLAEVGLPENPLCACGALSAPAAPGLARELSSAGATLDGVGRKEFLVLADGARVQGVLLADDRMAVTLRLADGRERTVPYEELAPRSVYRLRKARTPRDDGRRLLELANFARDGDLYAYAARHYRQAVDADPGLSGKVDRELARWRDQVARDRLARARRAQETGDFEAAESEAAHLLTELPEEAAAADAAALLAEVQEALAAQRDAARRDPAAAEAELARARDYRDRAAAQVRRGLVARVPSRAVKRLEKAVELAEVARAEIALVQDRRAAEVAVVAAAAALDRQVVDLVVDAHLHLASIHLARSAHRDALAALRGARRHSPDDPEVHAMQRRIELEANGLGWGVFGVAIHPGFLLLD